MGTAEPRTRFVALWIACLWLLVGTILIAVNATTPSSQVAPSSGALLGAYVKSPSGLSFLDGVSSFESKLGRPLDIVNKFHDWTNVTYRDEQILLNSGHEVMISWHPSDNLKK